MNDRMKENTMSKLRILNSSGDTCVVWDAKKAEVGDSEALAAIREAERIFKDHRAKGFTAFKVEPEGAVKINEFDQTAESIMMVPRVAGG